MKIKIEDNIINTSAALDLFEKDFRFDHAKGLAEWIKNSVDAYSLETTPDEKQEVIVIININKQQKIQSIEVVDFVGMSKRKIDEAFKIWFDPNAAKYDSEKGKGHIKTLGGHGNGGKFYMRGMFEESFLITFRSGKINGFGFDSQKRYGTIENLNDRITNLSEALKLSELDKYDIIMERFKHKLEEEKRFTVVRGIRPRSVIGKTNYIKGLIEKLTSHPQVRRIISRKKIILYLPSSQHLTDIIAPKIKPRKNFEMDFEFECPKELEFDGEKLIMYDQEPITLKLSTSEEPLKGINYRGVNSIDFLGEVGVIANYELSKLGFFQSSNFSEFIYGECIAKSMENNYVKNDRESFIDSDRTRALLHWVKKCVEEVCVKMDDLQRKNKKKLDLSKSSEFNSFLNKWKNRFLEKIFNESLGGIGNIGIDGKERQEFNFDLEKKKKRSDDHKKTTGDEGGSSRKKGNRFAQVLISSYDVDPLSEDGSTFECAARHPAVYQRPEDTKYGIYWINTSKEYANRILLKGSESERWKDYLFNRYIDIIIQETIDNLGKKELELNTGMITNEINSTISKIMDNAVEDLNNFLFESNSNDE